MKQKTIINCLIVHGLCISVDVCMPHDLLRVPRPRNAVSSLTEINSTVGCLCRGFKIMDAGF